MKVRMKRLHKDAVIPSYSNQGDAGMDLTAVSTTIDKYGNRVYYTGLAYEIPCGYVGLIFPRSSVSKVTLSLANSVGVIDSGYRGEIIFKFKPTSQFRPLADPKNFQRESLIHDDIYKKGDRVGQMIIVPYPQIELEETNEFTETERGTGGFGSTGQ